MMLKMKKVVDEDGEASAHLLYLDQDGAIHEFRSFFTLFAQDEERIEVMTTKEQDSYELDTTNAQN